MATAAVSAAFAALVAAVWYMVKGVFSKVPPVLSQLEPLLSEEGVEAMEGGWEWWRAEIATAYLEETHDTEGYYQIRAMSKQEVLEFIRERQSRGRSLGGFSITGRGGR